MRHITKLVAVLLVLVGPLGCQNVEPGVYNGDKTLYESDVTLSTAFAVVDATLKWERDNRALFADKPEIKAACDEIRLRAPGAFKAAFAVRDEYAATKTDASKTRLDIALTTIRKLATEAATLLQENGL